jgi:hypothetical protein
LAASMPPIKIVRRVELLMNDLLQLWNTMMYDKYQDNFVMDHYFNYGCGSLEITYYFDGEAHKECSKCSTFPCEKPDVTCQAYWGIMSGDIVWDDNFAKFKIEDWDSGMSLNELRNGCWVNINREQGLPLLNEEFSKSPSEIRKYLRTVPNDFLAITSPYPSKRYQLLKFLKSFPDSSFLLESNPGLYLLLLQRLFREFLLKDIQNINQQILIQKLISSKQTKILSWIAREEMQPSDLRFINQIEKDSYNSTSFFDLLGILKDKWLVHLFRHEKSIDPWKVINASNMQRDIITMKNVMENNFNRKIEFGIKIKTYDHLIMSHNYFVRIFEKYKNYDVIVERHGTGVFPPSPVKTPEWIKYIDTLQGLIEEGTQMHHCVGANFEFAYSGQEFYYKVLVPVRATLSLRISGDAVVIKELALLGNAKPSYETLRRVREWVNAVGLAIKT